MAITTAAFSSASNGSDKASYTPDRNPNVGVSYQSNYSGILTNQAVGGEVYTVERFGKRKSWGINYTFLTAADQAKLQAIIDYVDGKKTTFYFSEDNFGTAGTAVRFDQDSFSFEEVAQGATSITFNLIEQL